MTKRASLYLTLFVGKYTPVSWIERKNGGEENKNTNGSFMTSHI
jgi:hypothetical protein